MENSRSEIRPSITSPKLPVRGNPADNRMVKNFDDRTNMAQLAQLQNEAADAQHRAAADAIEEELRNMSIDREEEEPPAAPTVPVEEQDYFDSPEAKKLFIGDKNSPLSVREVLENRIALLHRVGKYSDGWREV